MNVGKSLKAAMAKRGLKQVDLARKLGVTKVYISTLASSDHAGMGTVNKLANAFDMTVSDFIKLGEDPKGKRKDDEE